MSRALACLALVLSLTAVADADDAAARRRFFTARADHAAGRHASAVKGLEEVVRQLGKPNQRVLPLLAVALHKLRDHVRAREAVDAYFKLSPPPDPALAEYRDMRALAATLEPLAARQRELLARATGPDLTPYRAYLQAHPHGPGAAAVRTRMRAQEGNNAAAADDAAYAAARRTNTSRAYEEYLRARPRGRNARAARTELERAFEREDDLAFDRARGGDGRFGYQDYLKRRPHGRHAGEARDAVARLDQATRRREGERLIEVAQSLERDARGRRARGGLKIGGGLVLVGGGIAVLATGVAGTATSYWLGGSAVGLGLLFAVKSKKDFTIARQISDEARGYRERAAPMLTSGHRTLGLGVAFAF